MTDNLVCIIIHKSIIVTREKATELVSCTIRKYAILHVEGSTTSTIQDNLVMVANFLTRC